MTISISTIKRTVAQHFGTPPKYLEPSYRKRHVCHDRTRQMAMYLSRTVGKHSYMKIGRAFGRDHTSCIHAVQAILADAERAEEANVIALSLGPALSLRSRVRAELDACKSVAEFAMMLYPRCWCSVCRPLAESLEQQ